MLDKLNSLNNMDTQIHLRVAGMISSKDLLEKTGISRATLNNYIALGVLPRPTVVSSPAGEPGVRRLGYFQDDAIDLVTEIKNLKAGGMSMDEIASKFQPEAKTQPSRRVSVPGSESAQQAAQSGKDPLSVTLTVDNIPGAAFMLNNQFEMTWWNDRCGDLFSNINSLQSRDISNRNIFQQFLDSQTEVRDALDPILAVLMRAAKKRMDKRAISAVFPQIAAQDSERLLRLYDEVEAVGSEDILHIEIDLPSPHTLYISFFREGAFFTFIPEDHDKSSLLHFLGQRSQVIQGILLRRRPFLTNLVCMVADLQSSVRICSELPADEYFELINQIWQRAEPIFRRYKATHGKHVGDGMVYYFLPQPDSDYIMNSIECAAELRQLMEKMSADWRARKNWHHHLHLNIGLNEGQEWFGTYHAGTHIEFTVLGDTINHAARLSDFARDGAIWATKNLIGRLSREQRSSIRYGVIRHEVGGGKILAPDLFARVSDLIDIDDGKYYKFRDIAGMPIAEIVELQKPQTA